MCIGTWKSIFPRKEPRYSISPEPTPASCKHAGSFYCVNDHIESLKLFCSQDLETVPRQNHCFSAPAKETVLISCQLPAHFWSWCAGALVFILKSLLLTISQWTVHIENSDMPSWDVYVLLIHTWPKKVGSQLCFILLQWWNPDVMILHLQCSCFSPS